MKKLLSLALSASLLAAAAAPAGAVYQDIPSGSALAREVQKAVDYGLMNGYSAENFGYADPMTRAQFVTVLDRMLLPQGNDETLIGHITPAMQVDYQTVKAYYGSIDAAAEHDWVDTDQPFRPSDPITRGEMAEILVRALGLKGAAKLAESASTLPFTDVTEGRGYIAVAYAIGMTKGTSDTTFSPDATATRAQAAAMLVRIYEKLGREPDWVHGFYAISSYSQLSYAQDMDAVSAGWSHMVWDLRFAGDHHCKRKYILYPGRLRKRHQLSGRKRHPFESERIHGGEQPAGDALFRNRTAGGCGSDHSGSHHCLCRHWQESLCRRYH